MPLAVLNYRPYYGCHIHLNHPLTILPLQLEIKMFLILELMNFWNFLHKSVLVVRAVVIKSPQIQRIQHICAREAPNGLMRKIWCYLVGGLNMKLIVLLGETKKCDAYWGKIVEYCNEHCSFDPRHDGVACRNHFNFINKILGKWIDAYDNAKRMQQSQWSKNDVLAKANELYSSCKNGQSNLMSEWLAVRMASFP